MSKLTDQQIEAAAKDCYEAQFLPNDYLDKKIGSMWDLLADHCKASYRRSVVAAAPFLQLPWDDPTDPENELAFYEYSRARGGVEIDNHRSDAIDKGVRMALFLFVRTRNANLMPKLLDPRVTMLVDFFSKNHLYKMTIPEFAKEILELLDRKE